MVWTTTPWTLISNVAAAVGPDITYVRISDPDGGADLVLGESAAQRRYPDAEPTERWPGRDLLGWHYDRPFHFLEAGDGEPWRAVAADYVYANGGSRLVHLDSAFAATEAAAGRADRYDTVREKR